MIIFRQHHRRFWLSQRALFLTVSTALIIGFATAPDDKTGTGSLYLAGQFTTLQVPGKFTTPAIRCECGRRRLAKLLQSDHYGQPWLHRDPRSVALVHRASWTFYIRESPRGEERTLGPRSDCHEIGTAVGSNDSSRAVRVRGMYRRKPPSAYTVHGYAW
jgi:hypothetical protein